MSTLDLLNHLNKTYLDSHIPYEEAFWLSYMGDKTYDEPFVSTKTTLDGFKSSAEHYTQVQAQLAVESDPELFKRLQHWEYFFRMNSTPDKLKDLKTQIITLEKSIDTSRSNRVQWYTDPTTGEFVSLSEKSMYAKMATESDENLRKAYYHGICQYPLDDLAPYVQLVALRNQYAQALGYKHFYDYKTQIEERMDCEVIWKIFDDLYEQAESSRQYLYEMEKNQPWLREPWNMGYYLSWDFTKQEDPYFRLQDQLMNWGLCMTRLGVNYRGATMQLDLMERDGKYNNGFCHMPVPAHYTDGMRQSVEIGFTCCSRPDVIGDGFDMWHTLFHEWGHAAHFAHMDQQDVILNTEYPPASTAWAETQSMFMDSVMSSIEYKTLYAQNSDGDYFPWDQFEARVRKLHPLAGRRMMSIAAMVQFERQIYTSTDLTTDKVLDIANGVSLNYFSHTTPLPRPLLAVHPFNWESACSYHGYGMADLAVYQYREFFFERDGYILDNPLVWPRMEKFRKFGSSLPMDELVLQATGKPLSPDAYLRSINKTIDEVLDTARERIATARAHQSTSIEVNLDTTITLVHGKEMIASSTEWFDVICDKFTQFLMTQKK